MHEWRFKHLVSACVLHVCHYLSFPPNPLQISWSQTFTTMNFMICVCAQCQNRGRWLQSADVSNSVVDVFRQRKCLVKLSSANAQQSLHGLFLALVSSCRYPVRKRGNFHPGCCHSDLCCMKKAVHLSGGGRCMIIRGTGKASLIWWQFMVLIRRIEYPTILPLRGCIKIPDALKSDLRRDWSTQHY